MNAEEVYVDPSALARLYIHQPGSREVAAWRAKIGGALVVTHHGRTEIVNTICRVAFLGHLVAAGLEKALADFTADFAGGRLHLADLLWRAALNRSEQLSRNHTPKLGTRSPDVLHVACALELKRGRFLTFDGRQRQLAKTSGPKPVRL